MQTVPIIIGVIVFIVGVGYLATSSSAKPNPIEQDRTTSSTIGTTETSDQESTTTDASAVEATTSTGTAVGTYTTYNPDTVAQSDAEHILLFFHATWCPSCKALDTDITAHADSIPAEVAIFKVDYDTATDLKRQYGVTTQHSVIEINAAGEAQSGITHPLTFEEILDTV